MANSIVYEGVVTPFVVMNFAGGCIDIMPPRYFVSFNHIRTSKQACQFTLTITYIPDTFNPGTPGVIHNLLLSSKHQRVTYQYGYYDSDGHCHMQQQLYNGTFYEYDENVDLETGQLTYVIKGVANVVEFLNQRTSIVGITHLIRPSEWVRDLVTRFPAFRGIGDNYTLDIDHTDAKVKSISARHDEGVLDILMGKVKEDGTRIGGLVDLSKRNLTSGEALSMGIITQSEQNIYDGASYALSSYGIKDSEQRTEYRNTYNKIRERLHDNFICFFDDVSSGYNNHGTFYYIPKGLKRFTNTYLYEYGNNVLNSDVLSFSVTYDGAVALASAGASDTIANSIDEQGNNIGSSHMVSPSDQLYRNIYPTVSGFNEEAFFSDKLLTECLVYPFKAKMTVMGQIQPNQLLDIIYVVILVNGTEHPSMTGEYKILSIVDNLDSSGFTTEFELVRVASSVQEARYETYVANSENSPASILDARIKESREGSSAVGMFTNVGSIVNGAVQSVINNVNR